MKRKLLYITLIKTILCVISIIICNRRIKKNASQKLYTEITETPKNNVGLLLGTSPKLKNGNNNLYFDYRIFATLELYKAGKINYILISGDNRKENYNEPEEMKKALMQRGVPEKYIYLDYAGFRTLDSVVRAKEVSESHRFRCTNPQLSRRALPWHSQIKARRLCRSRTALDPV